MAGTTAPRFASRLTSRAGLETWQSGPAWLLCSRWADFPYFYHSDEPSKVRQVIEGTRNLHHPPLMLDAAVALVAAYLFTYSMHGMNGPPHAALLHRQATSANRATVLSIVASVLAAYAIVRLRYRGAQWVGGFIFLAYLVPPSILFIPLATMVFQFGLFDTRLALILTYPTFLIPFCTWLLMGYFKTIPFELEECALIDGASRWQILTKIIQL